MSGFEYALAGLMLSEGMEKEGKQIVKSVYDRYDGKKRNPYNEIECGSNYARGMASWSFIPILSGFECDAVNKKMGFSPRTTAKTYTSFWSCGDAWGTVRFDESGIALDIIEGELKLKEFNFKKLKGQGSVRAVICDEMNAMAKLTDKSCVFENTVNINKTLVITMA